MTTKPIYKKPIPSFAELLGKSHKFTKLSTQTQLLTQLDRGLKAFIGGPLASHFQVSRIRYADLILYVDNGIWAHALRMNTQKILELMSEIASNGERYTATFSAKDISSIANIKAIKIRVRPPVSARPANARQKPARKISTVNAAMLLETAAIFEDEELKAKWTNFIQKNTR